ncbi:hypothetical protein YB2330_006006 [Saitoella coloradoensis]
MSTEQPQTKPWHENFPAPKCTPTPISAADFKSTYLDDPTKLAGRDYLLVDVRRTDYLDHAVPTSINIPAQSFYPTRLTWVKAFKEVPVVAFYCGSSNGRGPRVAGWFGDAVEEVKEREGGEGVRCESFVLSGGVKGWVKEFGEEGAMKVVNA